VLSGWQTSTDEKEMVLTNLESAIGVLRSAFEALDRDGQR
jgi:hypothetical protein